jgi:hypothetical protein
MIRRLLPFLHRSPRMSRLNRRHCRAATGEPTGREQSRQAENRADRPRTEQAALQSRPARVVPPPLRPLQAGWAGMDRMEHRFNLEHRFIQHVRSGYSESAACAAARLNQHSPTSRFSNSWISMARSAPRVSPDRGWRRVAGMMEPRPAQSARSISSLCSYARRRGAAAACATARAAFNPSAFRGCSGSVEAAD